MTQRDLEKFILKWNRNFPVDRWWRKKYKIPFLSKEHREISFLNQVLEFKEDCLYLDLKEEKEEYTYIPNTGDFFKPIKIKDIPVKSLEEEVAEFRREQERLKENGRQDD